jgi:hypothetical protein
MQKPLKHGGTEEAEDFVFNPDPELVEGEGTLPLRNSEGSGNWVAY